MSSCTQKVDTGIYQDKAGTAITGAQDSLNRSTGSSPPIQTAESYATRSVFGMN